MINKIDASAARQLHGLLQRALAHMQRDEMEQAEGYLSQARKIAPDDANVLQFTGVVRVNQGRLEEAEALYRRSLAVEPAQPHVLHNLARLLYHASRFDEAIELLEEALRQRPDYGDAALRLGHCYQSKGLFADAEHAYRKALQVEPTSLMVQQSLGGVLNDMGRNTEAEQLLRAALEQSRDQRQTAALHHNLAASLKQQGRFEEALELFDRAKAAAADIPIVDYNRGGTLQELGRLDEAVEAYRSAIVRNPLNLDAHNDLNRLLYRLGRDEELLQSLDDVAAGHPKIGGLPLLKADLLFKLDRFAEAADYFRRAAPLEPEHVMPHDGLGLAEARLGHFDEAIAAHERAVALEPDNAAAWTNFAETLLRAGDPERALKVSEQAMEIAPELQHSLAMWGLALRMLDDPREQTLNDYERLVEVFDVPPPEGFADMDSFNAALNAELDRLHKDRREALDQTLRSGTQTLGNLFGRGHDLVERLRVRIDDVVNQYIASMDDDDEHHLFRRRSRDTTYSSSWSSRLSDCGYHTNHLHPLGWISSCYYIALPEAVADTQEKQGWIKFGEPSFDAGFKEPICRTIQPQPGRLVLFPSYMWHGTVPFRSEQDRTTIAFDVVPR